MIRVERPSLPVLELDGFKWRPALPGDAAALEALAAAGANRILFRLPPAEEDFAAAIGRPGFRLAFICERGSQPLGAAATTMRNQRSLNLQLISFFAEPLGATLPLAAYVRHIFWTLPMHRLHVQLPRVPGSDAYTELLLGVGFVEEGVVRGHALIAGQARDLIILGLLRKEFEAWCLQTESRLTL